MSFNAFLDPNKPEDVQVLLHKLAPYRGKGKRVCDLPSKYRNYRQHNFFGPQFKRATEFRKICDVANKIQAQAHTPDSYTRDWNAVFFIVGMHYPTADEDERPRMSLDRDGFFSHPSLARVMYVWIGILEECNFEREIAICLIMSSVLIFDLLQIAGLASWADDAKKDADSLYWYALRETRDASTSLLRHMIRSCPNLIGVFTVGRKAFEDFPFIKNTGTTVINDVCMMHGCILSGGRADEYQRAVFYLQSVSCI